MLIVNLLMLGYYIHKCVMHILTYECGIVYISKISFRFLLKFCNFSLNYKKKLARSINVYIQVDNLTEPTLEFLFV